ncbi:MAG: ABC transporter ATP-binding protein [Hyphomicrobiales bacterium]|nr:ABC transporter ATP-binding protein [Hyphomicrobiales bacterium]
MPVHSDNSAEIDIEFHGVTKNFDDVVAVDDVSLSVERGSFFSLLGPSGCGKTTSLRLIAGFEQPTAGEVVIGGQAVNGVPAYRRPVNMVFQHYALFPHLSVADNVGYGLRQRSPRPDSQQLAVSVAEALELVRLSGFERRRTWELSGGQQQRVALARALINRPTVLLLDEPLAALDRKLRQEMQIELQTLQRDVGITFVLVTHDQEEALSMSDKICLMLEGRIVQIGGPRELYDEPKNRYVAGFVGKSNIFSGRVVDSSGDIAAIELDSGRVLRGRPPRGGLAPGRNRVANIAVRPELVHISSADDDTDFSADVEASARVKNRIFLGEQTEYLLEAGDLGDILVLVSKHAEGSSGGFSAGDVVKVGWNVSSALALEEGGADAAEQADKSH